MPTAVLSIDTAGPPAAETPGWCSWYKDADRAVVAVDSIEVGSGPGAFLYACAPCRDQCDLEPLDLAKADR